MIRRVFGLLLFLLASSALPASAAAAAAPSGPALSILDPTQLVSTTTSEGTCATASQISGRANAWRCSVAAPSQFGANVLDPCYSTDASSGLVVCPLSYPGGMTAVQVTLTSPLGCDPASGCQRSDQPSPAVVELTDGTSCRFAGDTALSVGSQRASFSCGDGSWLLGSPQVLADGSWQISQTPSVRGGTGISMGPETVIAHITHVWEE